MSLRAASTQILVTGGTGFIGSHICISLINSGFKVVCLDNLSNGKKMNLEPVLNSPELTLINGDIRSIEDCERAMEGCTHVCHLAARASVLGSSNEELMENNLMGTENLVKCAIKKNDISMFVFSSSCAVYGDAEPPITLETKLDPISIYGESKMLAEELILNSGLNYRILRYFNVYGPRQRDDSPYSAVIPIFFRKLLAGLPPTIYGGEQTRDFIHVDDVVSANLSALKGGGESIQNIGTGRATSIAELLQQIQHIMMQGDMHLALEPPVIAQAREGEIQHSWCGDATASISLETGLLGTISNFLEEVK